jgi:hypothetical protein
LILLQMRPLRQAIIWGCVGWISACPYFDVGSNALPLAFGMTPEVAAAALQSPLAPLSGRRNSEIYYTERATLVTGPILRDRERLWLQFRRGRLTGWKYDWNRPSAW